MKIIQGAWWPIVDLSSPESVSINDGIDVLLCSLLWSKLSDDEAAWLRNPISKGGYKKGLPNTAGPSMVLKPSGGGILSMLVP